MTHVNMMLVEFNEINNNININILKILFKYVNNKCLSKYKLHCVVIKLVAK